MNKMLMVFAILVSYYFAWYIFQFRKTGCTWFVYRNILGFKHSIEKGNLSIDEVRRKYGGSRKIISLLPGYPIYLSPQITIIMSVLIVIVSTITLISVLIN